tara:strand:- start:5661 stop:5834 length:174 start_codon:yes stop_codon:yes gene_type:complete
MNMDGEIPTIIFLIIGVGFTVLSYIHFKRNGKTIETVFLSIIAILFFFSYFALLMAG